jgi:predicted DNA-binding protein (UPF0251 family)
MSLQKAMKDLLVRELEAVKAVKAGDLSIKDAANAYIIPRRILSDLVSGV